MLISAFAFHPQEAYPGMGYCCNAVCEMSLFLSEGESGLGEPFSQDQTCAPRAWGQSQRVWRMAALPWHRPVPPGTVLSSSPPWKAIKVFFDIHDMK